MHVELRDLGHSYDTNAWLFRNLSYDFRPGRSYAVTGASGSGKSTLMAVVAGWVDPTEGAVRRHEISRISWVLQSAHGVARRSAGDHVAYPLLARGLTTTRADAQARRILHRFDLGHVAEQDFRHLSGGEAQRLMLARATAIAPSLLLVDEPTSQLDRAAASTVNRVLVNTIASGTIVVVATHDPETQEACDEHLDLTVYARCDSAS